MNLDSFLSGSTPAPQTDEGTTTKANNENDWFSSLASGVGIGSAPEKNATEAVEKPPEVDWFSSLTGGSVKGTAEKSAAEEEETSTPNAKENDWLGGFVEGIGLGGQKDEGKTDAKTNDEDADDWLANFAGGLGFGNKKEDTSAEDEAIADEAKASDKNDKGEETKSESIAERTTEASSTMRNEPSKAASSTASAMKSEDEGQKIQDDLVDVALTDHFVGAVTSPGDAVEQTGKFESIENAQGFDRLKSPTVTSRVENEQLASKPSIDSRTQSLDGDLVDQIEPSEVEPTIDDTGTEVATGDGKSSVRNVRRSVDDVPESGKSESESGKSESVEALYESKDENASSCEVKMPVRPQLNRGLEKNSFTSSIRNLMGFADDQESSNGTENDEEINKKAETGVENQEGLMDFFGNLLGKQESKQDIEASSAIAKPPSLDGNGKEAMGLEESSESDSQTHRQGEVVFLNGDEKMDGFEEVGATIQAQVSNATENVNSLFCSVQSFVSDRVTQLVDHLIVIPRHPKAHKRRGKPWWSFQFS